MCTYLILGKLDQSGENVSKPIEATDDRQALLMLGEFAGVKPDHKGLHRRVRKKLVARVTRELASKFGQLRLMHGRKQVFPVLREREAVPKRGKKHRGRYRNRKPHRHGWASPRIAA